MNKDNQFLKWRFDISTFELIGRDLITDRVTAVYELVKNSYDANATCVQVILNNVASTHQNGTIVIQDNGYGMSFEDIRDKWMVIGTSSKRRSPFSPEPFNRKCVGEKGIGRFAVDKLGDEVVIETKKGGDEQWLSVRVNWKNYFQKDDETEIKLFTDVENPYTFKQAENTKSHGTMLRVSEIREPWTRSDIEQLISEISKIVSPLSNLSMPFKVKVIAPEFDIDQEAVADLKEFQLSTFTFSIEYNNKKNTQETIFYDATKNKFEKKDVQINPYFGGIKLRVYYFDESARRKYRKLYPNNPIDGFNVYRDDILATPFVEANKSQDQKRDILGIDKRLWQDIFSRVSTREFIGIINITKKDNPNIIDATNRQDFVDNMAYREFKKFVITQLDAVQKYKEESRKKNRAAVKDGLSSAMEDVSRIIDSSTNLLTTHPQLKDSINPIISQAKKTRASVNKAIKEKKKSDEESIRKENVYLSIMSLQDYGIQIAHAVRTTLKQLKGRIAFFYRYYPDPSKENIFKKYSKQMLEKTKVLSRVVNYMLSYSQSNLTPEEINVKDALLNIFDDYKEIFNEKNIEIQNEFKQDIVLNSNMQFFRDIFQNLIDNSIKAVETTSQKIIRCTYKVSSEKLQIFFSDTGIGIPIENREQVFTLYYTTTEEQGGAGVGLYIVRTRVQSMKGTVKVIDSEFGKVGTTFLIEIPFKK